MYNGKSGKKKDYSQLSLDDFSDDDSDDGGGGFHDEPNEADDYIRNQQVLMKMQDAGLDALSESVMRLGEMSNNISEELGQQNKMLDSMEMDLDNAGSNLPTDDRNDDEKDFVSHYIRSVLRKREGPANRIVVGRIGCRIHDFQKGRIRNDICQPRWRSNSDRLQLLERSLFHG